MSDCFQVFPYLLKALNPKVKLNVCIDIFENFYSQFTLLVTINVAMELKAKLTMFEYLFELTKFEQTFEF